MVLRPQQKAAHQAFTLVELMIVVAIIGLLAVISIPSFLRARESAQNGRYIADRRTAKGAFMVYCIDHGQYPPDRTPGIVPLGMAEYLAAFQWTAVNSLGGRWDWDYQQFGCTAGVAVYQPAADAGQIERIDEAIDDGYLATGSFRARASGYISIIE